MNEDDKALSCECNDYKWYHASCIHINDEQYKILESGDSPNLLGFVVIVSHSPQALSRR